MKNVFYNLIGIISLLVGLNSCSSKNPNLKTKIANDAMLIDVRTESEFSKGTARGAINIPLDQVESRIEEFKTNREIVLFCRSGNRSGKALDLLNSKGITNVINGGTWKDVLNLQDQIENGL